MLSAAGANNVGRINVQIEEDLFSAFGTQSLDDVIILILVFVLIFIIIILVVLILVVITIAAFATLALVVVICFCFFEEVFLNVA